MVAPTAGKLKDVIDALALELDKIEGLRVYKYPAENISEFPAAIIRDQGSTDQSAASEFRATTPTVIYNVEVLILVNLGDEQEAFEELEKYISANSSSSIFALMTVITVSGVQSIQLIRATPRLRMVYNQQHVWGCTFWIQTVVS